MKNNKSFKKFSTRSSLRERSKRELLKIAEEVNVGTKAAKVTFTEERYSNGRQKSRDIVAEGIFAESSGGYGFCRLDNGERDVFIPESNTLDALDGDRVRIRYHKFLSSSGDEKTEGRVLEILEYGRKTVIGTVESDLYRIGRRRINRLYIIPDESGIKKRIFLDYAADARVGDKVLAKLNRSSHSFAVTADVVSNFGDSLSKEANYESILAECEIADGRFYGSVTTKDISEELKKQFGIEIDKRKLELDCQIKAFGTYKVTVKLYTGISGKLSVQVVEK